MRFVGNLVDGLVEPISDECILGELTGEQLGER